MISSHRKSLCSPAASALWTLLTMAWLPVGGVAWAQQGKEVRLARYTTSSSAPDAAQIAPLEAVVQVSFPRASVATVGDAMNYLLLRSGYRLAAQQRATPREQANAPRSISSHF